MTGQAIMELQRWTNPGMVDIVAEVGDITTLGNCGACGGVGRIIIHDKKSGKTHSVTCANCKGSGQK